MRHSRGPAASAPLRATLALLLGVAFAQPGLAQPAPAAPPADPIVAKVDGEEIRFSDLANAAQELPEELRGAPPQMLYPLLLDQMIAGRAVAAAARRAGLDNDEAVRARIRRAEEQELQQAYLSRALAGLVTEERIRAAYDAEIRARPAEEEVRARHILVETEADAKALIADIKKGGNFEELAKKASKDPGSGANGGDLDWAAAGSYVPEFSGAMVKLDKGQMTDTPVKTQFGFHIIRVDDVREAQLPKLEEVKPQIAQQLQQQKLSAYQEGLRSKAKIQ